MAAPADYGLGRTQLAAVSRSSDGLSLLWTIKNSDGSVRTLRFGSSGDMALSNCSFLAHAPATLAVLRKSSDGVQLRYRASEESRTRRLRIPAFKEVYRASCGDISRKGADALIVHGSKEVRGVRQDVLAAIDPLTRKVIFSRNIKRGSARALVIADINGAGNLGIGVLKRAVNDTQIVDFYLSPVSHIPVTIEPVREITAASLLTSDQRICEGLMYRTVTNQLKSFNFCDLIPESLIDVSAMENGGKIRLVPSVNVKLFR